jgi:hypothetical protein
MTTNKGIRLAQLVSEAYNKPLVETYMLIEKTNHYIKRTEQNKLNKQFIKQEISQEEMYKRVKNEYWLLATGHVSDSYKTQG